MATFSLAREFAGIAAAEIIAYLRPALADAEIGEAVQLVRECCAAAIISALIQQRREAATGNQESE